MYIGQIQIDLSMETETENAVENGAYVAIAYIALKDGSGRRIRESANLSRKQFGALMGRTQRAVRAYELGERSPRQSDAIRYAKALRMLQLDNGGVEEEICQYQSQRNGGERTHLRLTPQ